MTEGNWAVKVQGQMKMRTKFMIDGQPDEVVIKLEELGLVTSPSSMRKFLWDEI